MLVISIATNMIFTGNQILIRFHVSGSVGIAPERDSVETMVTDTMFCSNRLWKRRIKEQNNVAWELKKSEVSISSIPGIASKILEH